VSETFSDCLPKHRWGRLLNSVLQLRDESRSKAHSLAPDPLHQQLQIATFSLQEGTAVALPINGEYTLEGQCEPDEKVEIDDDFCGFTPLNGPPSRGNLLLLALTSK